MQAATKMQSVTLKLQHPFTQKKLVCWKPFSAGNLRIGTFKTGVLDAMCIFKKMADMFIYSRFI